MKLRPDKAVRRTQEQLDRITLWAARNRGIQSRIAEEMKPAITPQFVHHVLMGRRKSKGGLVEKKLRGAGAPI